MLRKILMLTNWVVVGLAVFKNVLTDEPDLTHQCVQGTLINGAITA